MICSFLWFLPCQIFITAFSNASRLRWGYLGKHTQPQVAMAQNCLEGEDRDGDNTDKTNKQHNSRNKQQSPHTPFLATTKEWFPSKCVYHKDPYRQMSSERPQIFQARTFLEARDHWKGEIHASSSKVDFSQGRDVGTKGFCRIRLLKSGELFRHPEGLGKL